MSGTTWHVTSSSVYPLEYGLLVQPAVVWRHGDSKFFLVLYRFTLRFPLQTPLFSTSDARISDNLVRGLVSCSSCDLVSFHGPLARMVRVFEAGGVRLHLRRGLVLFSHHRRTNVKQSFTFDSARCVLYVSSQKKRRWVTVVEMMVVHVS